MSEAASDADLVRFSRLPTRFPCLSSFSSGVTFISIAELSCAIAPCSCGIICKHVGFEGRPSTPCRAQQSEFLEDTARLQTCDLLICILDLNTRNSCSPQAHLEHDPIGITEQSASMHISHSVLTGTMCAFMMSLLSCSSSVHALVTCIRWYMVCQETNIPHQQA